MSSAASELLQAMLNLTESDRAELAARLIESLDPLRDDDVGRAWEQEIARRVGELDRGLVQTIPWTTARQIISGASDGQPNN